MNIKAIFASALLIILAAVFSSYILRCRGVNLLRRLPILLELSVPLFLVGLAVLPEAFPSFFASILHHSIVSDYEYPIGADRTQVTETWILARWWSPISWILYAAVFVGIIWASWNIFRAQGRKLNVIALCLGLLWISLGALAHLRVLPF